MTTIKSNVPSRPNTINIITKFSKVIDEIRNSIIKIIHQIKVESMDSVTVCILIVS